ncbi:uncharacterized protein LOC130793296 isoform X2 [Actinidia eriantha]|uniref:uncharacterized protein LOC130793296 isoform X2 n=1 Tax=Actinidia eriantha TaxID=165200 RepID=UPI002583DF2D|nr:uncharacterized protein LOC130793296 isoform X2 [Actinidia eriantha]
MSSVTEIKSSPDKAAETFCKSKERSRISYTRDFLLSLSGLDVCKKLPSGFDQSIISEYEDTSHGVQEWQRPSASLPFQSSRRIEYGSSPPSRGDSSNYSRGVYGRWDNRSSGRSERDSDSQSDRDSESGRRYGNQSRRSWQTSEHDGLLGSGSFPRPSGAAGAAPKVDSNDHYQLNRSSEPYHPPRPYKAVPYSRRDTKDSYNDETFGGTEYTSDDRAEEERRRRVSFEMMRKEQEEAFQDKQKLDSDKHKDGHVSDIIELLEDAKDGTRVFSSRSYELDESVAQPQLNNDSGKSSLQTPAFRPPVPPGFRSTILESTSSPRPLIPSHSAEVGRLELEESLSQAKAVGPDGTLDDQEERQTVQKMGSREQQYENTSIHAPLLTNGQQIFDSSADVEVSNKKLGTDNQLCRTSYLPKTSETLSGSEINEFDTKKVMGQKLVSDPKQDHPTSILDKIFGSASTVNLNESSGFIEHHDTERNDTRSPSAVLSSKFAQWFLEDEQKAAEDPSYALRNDLLSLIVSREKGGSPVSDVNATRHFPSDLPLQPSEFINGRIASSTIGISEQFNNNKEEVVSTILTCEDLEQTILYEYSKSSSTLQKPALGFVSGVKTEESKPDVDNLASQHLMSLLQKGSGLKDITQSPDLESGSSINLHVSEGSIIGTALDNSREREAENICHSGKTLTLETLFGSAFMKELQSVDAPVSSQRGSVGSARLDILEPQGSFVGVTGDALFPTSTAEIYSSRSSRATNVLQSSPGQQTKMDKNENWLGFNPTQVEVVSSKQQTDVDIQLPEEESLITVGDPANALNSMLMSTGSTVKGESLSSSNPVDIFEKLAFLNTVFKDERAMASQEGPPFVCHPCDPIEPEIGYRNLHGQPSTPHLHRLQMNHRRPLFHPLESLPAHLNSQMNFNHDAPNHQFPVNMLRPHFHHPNTGPTGFELPPHHPMLQQQMQTPGNFPPHHLLQEFRRGRPQPPQPSNRATGFMQELNQMQVFPFHQQQSNFGGHGMPLPGPHHGGGNNHSEAFQRLLEMECRANSKQIPPFAAVGHSQGMANHELEMGFGYR